MRFNAGYPGFERMHVEDLVVDGDRGVLRARVAGTGRRGRAGSSSPWPASRPCATASSSSCVEVWADVDQQAPEGTRPGLTQCFPAPPSVSASA